jgi:hypothetical protein
MLSKNLEWSVNESPHDVWLWHSLCKAYIMNGNESRAIKICEKGIEKCRSNPAPFFTLSNVYARNGYYSDAISAFMKYFHNDEYSIPMSNTSFSFSLSNLVKKATLRSLASPLAAWDVSDEKMNLHLAAWTGNLDVIQRNIMARLLKTLSQIGADATTPNVDKPSLTPLHGTCTRS